MTDERTPPEVTSLLRSIGPASGNTPSSREVERLFEFFKRELRAMASSLMRHERPEHTLQPTALVNEAFLKLIGDEPSSWENRAHFFGVAGRVMRQVLVEYARGHNAQKRGGDWHRVTLTDSLGLSMALEVEIIDLHRALEKLEGEDARAAQVVEMWFFGGLDQKEIAHLLGVTDRTVRNDWNFARLWLARELDPKADHDTPPVNMSR